MINIEKVIKGLEWILEDDRFGFGVNWENAEPRDEYEKAGKIITDTITLLKEQEAKIGHWIDTTQTIGFPRCKCSVCNSEAGAIWMHYCPICGVKMKQEGR